ncbi:hypothetical protein Esti_006516 [Eimeria stiedai]
MQGSSLAAAAWRCLRAASSSLLWAHRCGPHEFQPPTLWSCARRTASLCADAQTRAKDGQGPEGRVVPWACSPSNRGASAARDDWRDAHRTRLHPLPAVLTATACFAGCPMGCVPPVGSSCIPEGKAALYCNRQSVRFKMVKASAYRRRSRASPTGQSQKAHVGPRRLSSEYVTPGVVLVKQRRYIAWGFESKRRNRHRKMYPGENVGVSKDSSLVALAHGRVKFTHDVARDVLLCNVLPEPREELLREDLWRYRTEHVASKEENRHVCHLRMKATRVFPRPLVNPPTKPLPRPKWLSAFDSWQNPTLPDAPPLAEDRLTGIERAAKGVRGGADYDLWGTLELRSAFESGITSSCTATTEAAAGTCKLAVVMLHSDQQLHDGKRAPPFCSGRGLSEEVCCELVHHRQQLSTTLLAFKGGAAATTASLHVPAAASVVAVKLLVKPLSNALLNSSVSHKLRIKMTQYGGW